MIERMLGRLASRLSASHASIASCKNMWTMAGLPVPLH
jgi:hypothetical protein